MLSNTSAPDQEDFNLYFQHDAALAGVTLGVDGTFSHPISAYSHPNYTTTIPVSAGTNCMYEQHGYVDHQGAGVYSPWSHTSNNMGTLLHRTYHYATTNGYGSLQQHQQPTSPGERSDSAQSYASSPSCASLHSPVASPATAAAPAAHFAYSSCSSSRSNSNCNSPSAGLVQHQSSYQELYSPVRWLIESNLEHYLKHNLRFFSVHIKLLARPTLLSSWKFLVQLTTVAHRSRPSIRIRFLTFTDKRRQ